MAVYPINTLLIMPEESEHFAKINEVWQPIKKWPKKHK